MTAGDAGHRRATLARGAALQKGEPALASTATHESIPVERTDRQHDGGQPPC